METTVTTAERPSPVKVSTETGNIILRNQREGLFRKSQDIQIHNAETNKQGYFGILTDRSSRIFKRLCHSKFGLSREHLRKLNREELEELATVVYEQSRKWYFIQTGVCILIPVLGWSTLAISNFPSEMSENEDVFAMNMRYYKWYKKIRK